ncbi:hypothetical protein COK19_15890 [Bacillus cereus]|uniref:hypothetical protein n=1 Tax=Bacillus cereus TaxID=1396 RepID=UPI000BF466C9|nr:hypothetical protein [Bacillus cereus]PFR25363.1 hypothetical protein COK19_15890 [Bacillus cereus]
MLLSEEVRKYLEEIQKDELQFNRFIYDIHQISRTQGNVSLQRNEFKSQAQRFIKHEKGMNINSFDLYVIALNKKYDTEIISIISVNEMNDWRKVFLAITNDIPFPYQVDYKNPQNKELLVELKAAFLNLILYSKGKTVAEFKEHIKVVNKMISIGIGNIK